MILYDRYFEVIMMIWKNLKFEVYRKELMEINIKVLGSFYERWYLFGIFCKECMVELSLEWMKIIWKVFKVVFLMCKNK